MLQESGSINRRSFGHSTLQSLTALALIEALVARLFGDVFSRSSTTGSRSSCDQPDVHEHRTKDSSSKVLSNVSTSG